MIVSITKTRLFKYIENVTTKNLKNSDKKRWYSSYFGEAVLTSTTIYVFERK